MAGDLEVYKREEGESVKMVKRAHLHENYEPVTRANDLALLELESPHALKTGFVSLARLPPTTTSTSDVEQGVVNVDVAADLPPVNTTLMALGWNVNLKNGELGQTSADKRADSSESGQF